MKELNICFAANNNYAMQTGVAIVSILENISDACYTKFWVLENDFSEENLKCLDEIKNKYNCDISMIDTSPVIRKIENSNILGKCATKDGEEYQRKLGAAAYVRLFISELLPDDVEKVVYLDSDIVVCGDLSEILDIKTENGIAAVFDVWPSSYNKNIGLSREDKYFSAGVQWIDLKYLREKKIQSKISDFVLTTNNHYRFFDQDILNVLFGNCITVLPLQYNLMWVNRAFNPEQVLSFAEKNDSTYYSIEEQKFALNNPIIIHYAGEILGRPWIRPFSSKYTLIWRKYFLLSPWKKIGITRCLNINKASYFVVNVKGILKKVILSFRGKEKMFKNYIYWVKGEINNSVQS